MLFLVPHLKASSAPNFHWAQSLGGSHNDRAHRVVTDGNGNSYITGYLASINAMFGPNTATNNSTSAYEQMFIAKFNRSGSNLWVRTAGGVDHDEGRAVAVDGAGNVYVTGGFGSNSAFDSTNLIAHGFSDVFIAKYDAEGNFLWVRQAWSTGFPLAKGLAIVTHGTNVYVAGQCEGGINFGGVLLTNTDLFLAKYNEAGDLLSARNVGYDPDYNSAPYAYDIAVDADENCYIASDFSDPQFTIGGTTLTRTGRWRDGLLSKWDSNGNLLWFKQVTEGFFGACLGVRLNPNGNVAVLGRTLAQGAFAGFAVANDFLANLSSTGGVIWVRSISTNGQMFSFASDLAGASFVTGNIFPGGTAIGGQFVTNSSLVALPFVAKFDTSGTLAWVKSAEVTSTNDGYNTAYGIDVDPSGAIYIAGQSDAVLRFDSSVTTNYGGCDVLLARIGPESPVLNVSHVASNLLLSWPTNQIGFLLEHSPASGTGWSQVTNPVVRVGSQFVSTNEIPGTTEFFRLKLNQ